MTTVVREPHMRAHRRSGFTLVEIMVVVIIIGILATLVIANVMGHSDKARVSTTRAMLSTVAQQLDIFKLDHGRYPDSIDDLMTAPNYITKPESYPKGGYLREQPLDGWGNKFVYRRGSGSALRPFDLLSYGADGREGGESFDADISSKDAPKVASR